MQSKKHLLDLVKMFPMNLSYSFNTNLLVVKSTISKESFIECLQKVVVKGQNRLGKKRLIFVSVLHQY